MKGHTKCQRNAKEQTETHTDYKMTKRNSRYKKNDCKEIQHKGEEIQNARKEIEKLQIIGKWQH